jgi:hypothetical protein
VADSGEDNIDGVALASLEVAAAEVPIRLHVANDGFDGRAAAQFALDDAEHAALLTGDEGAARIGGVVTAVALVDISALDRAAGELLGGIDDGRKRVTIIAAAPWHGARTGRPGRALVVRIEALTPIYGPRPRCKSDSTDGSERSAPIYPASIWGSCPEPS